MLILNFRIVNCVPNATDHLFNSQCILRTQQNEPFATFWISFKIVLTSSQPKCRRDMEKPLVISKQNHIKQFYFQTKQSYYISSSIKRKNYIRNKIYLQIQCFLFGSLERWMNVTENWYNSYNEPEREFLRTVEEWASKIALFG